MLVQSAGCIQPLVKAKFKSDLKSRFNAIIGGKPLKSIAGWTVHPKRASVNTSKLMDGVNNLYMGYTNCLIGRAQDKNPSWHSKGASRT